MMILPQLKNVFVAVLAAVKPMHPMAGALQGQAKTIPPSSPPPPARSVAVHLAGDAIDDSDRESDVIPDASENGLASIAN